MAKKEKKAKKKKEKAAKKPKKKKEKGEGGGAKAFFANHIEKMLFALAAGLCLFMVFSGFKNREVLKTSQSPSALDQEIKTVSSKVDQFSFSEHFQDIQKMDRKEFPDLANRALQPLKSESYEQNHYLRPPISPPRKKRTDPELYPVESLQVRLGFGIEPEATGGRFDGRRRQDGPVDPNELFQGQETEDLADNERSIPWQAMQQAGGGRIGGEGRGRGRSGQRNVGDGIYFAAVTGLVPVRKQLKEYQDRLLNSRGHDAIRDAPNYVNWVVLRADVGPGGKPGKFKKVANYARLSNQASGMPGGREGFMRGGVESGADNFDPKFSDPVLTQPAPTVEVRNAEEVFIHDTIVALTEAEKKKAEEERLQALESGVEDDPNSDFGPVQGAGPGRTSRDRRGGREGGYAGPPPGMEGPPPGFTDEGGYGGGSREGGGRRSMQRGAISGDMELDEAPEFLMFRYVDKTVEPGRSYAYKVFLYIEDPNNPNDGNKPSPDTIEATVGNRLARINDSIPNPRPPYYGRRTDESELSRTVRVRNGETILAGEVTPASRAAEKSIPGLVYRKPGSEPKAKIMALRFDQRRDTNVPGEVEVRPGAVVALKGEFEIPIWAKDKLVKEDVDLRFESCVLDIRGGEATKIDFLSRPAELLVWDGGDRIDVINQVDDEQLYKQNIFPDEEPRGGRGGESYEGGREGGPPPTPPGGREGGRRGRGRDG